MPATSFPTTLRRAIGLPGLAECVAVCVAMCTAAAGHAGAQVRVNPTGVSVNATGATTVFLTFGGVGNRVPREGVWCGQLMDATPDLGLRCDPGSIFGTLPSRYDLLRPSGRGAVTDIMSIPPSVARRAYEDAVRGARSTFFYVRRFESLTGGPDEYVAVTCRLTGGGARVPFALTDVQLAFDSDVPVLVLSSDGHVPPVVARIRYNGTGRLKGRWEVALPGDEPPTTEDLLPEAALPAERRGAQRRYTEVERFNVFLPPNGRFELQGPPPDRLPTRVDGTYLLLLRIEADSEREGDSDLGVVGAGDGILHSGAVAGFAIPPLRYVVGSGETVTTRAGSTTRAVGLLRPEDGALIPSGSMVVVRWSEDALAARYRVETAGSAHGASVFTAYVRRGVVRYVVPPFVWERVADDTMWWRIVALDAAGRAIRSSEWRQVRRAPAAPADSTTPASPATVP